MRLIILCGPPGVGKFSVARELASRTGYRLFHNHLVVDLLESLFEFGSTRFIELRERLWRDLLIQAAEDQVQGAVFTFAFDKTLSPSFPGSLLEACRKHEIAVSLVELTCTQQALEQRLVQPDRARFGKLNSVKRYHELASTDAFARSALPVHTAVIDTTGLSVRDSLTTTNSETPINTRLYRARVRGRPSAAADTHW